MSDTAVNVICRNLNDDRVIPRFAGYLRDHLGWTVTAVPLPDADVYYLSGYFELPLLKWRDRPMAAYFTHREEMPVKNNSKAQLYDLAARSVQLRIATAAQYAQKLIGYGPTVQITPPVERERFVPPHSPPLGGKLVAGFSGYTYANGRKGEHLAGALVATGWKIPITWRASGRGWPVKTKRHTWAEMPGFYQSLDVLVITASVEGVPMPALEALACGASVVMPRGVGLLDELPDVTGIHRYERGDAGDLVRAFGEAVQVRADVNQDELRAVTDPYTVAAWCEQHRQAFTEMFAREQVAHEPQPERIEIAPASAVPYTGEVSTSRGIYCVAFGEPARHCAARLIRSAKRHLPEIPIALCAAAPIGGEDVFIQQPDSDVGGRRAKLKAYELAPAEWQAVLYLDADTEVVGDIRFYFQLIEDGWEFAICKDPHLMDTMHAFRRSNNLAEITETEEEIHTLHTLQYNGGVWAFGRNERVAAFFKRWQMEWERHAQRDQGALIRAMYTDPLKVYLLGNEWNTFEKYSRGIETAGLMHYPGAARRWKGQIPGRIDSQAAWQMAERYEKEQRRR